MIKRERQYLELIFVLGLIGLAISGYLTYLHYFPAEEVFCDINETISCSPIEEYSTIFSIPLALLGIVWFGGLLSLDWMVLKKKKKLTGKILGWSIIGTLSVFYFIGLEIFLKTLCPFCTIVHIITLTTLVLAILLYKGK